MPGYIKATTLQNEAGTISIPVRNLQRRIIQRVSYTHRVGWWRANNDYYWVPGAYVDFRPMRGDTIIKVSFMVPARDYSSAHMISHWKFYRNDVEYGRHSRSGHHTENPFTQEWEVPSWGAGQYSRVGYKVRSYSEATHNTHLYYTEYWDGGGAGYEIQGQVIVEEYIPPWQDYEVAIFRNTGSDTWVAPADVTEIDVLVVGGGGGGGMDMGGGGGGGGVIYQTKYPVTPNKTYRIYVGAGGYGAPAGSGGYRTDGAGPQPSAHQFTISATSGQNSYFDDLIAIGGGYGGSSYFDYTPNNGYGASGGSGGGASGYSNGSTGRAGSALQPSSGAGGYGNNGGGSIGQYYSGGGGGAGGGGGVNPGTGGTGFPSSILGQTYYWAGGGGGAGYTPVGGYGGLGGGGGGAVGNGSPILGGQGLNDGSNGGGGQTVKQTNKPGGDAGANTGGGGGGGSHYNINNAGGEGGSGIVVVRWKKTSID